MFKAPEVEYHNFTEIQAFFSSLLVLFDPAVVIDRATIEHPEAPPLGIPGVMVSGEWVVDGGRITGRHPGVVLRPVAAGR